MQVAEDGVWAIWGKCKDEEAVPQPFIYYFLLVLPKSKLAHSHACLPSPPLPEGPFSSHILTSTAWVLGWTWIGCLPSIHLLGPQGRAGGPRALAPLPYKGLGASGGGFGRSLPQLSVRIRQ